MLTPRSDDRWDWNFSRLKDFERKIGPTLTGVLDGKTFQTEKAIFGRIFVPKHGKVIFIDALEINCLFNLHVDVLCHKSSLFRPRMFVRVVPIVASYRSDNRMKQ